MPVGLSNSACLRNLNALIIWLDRQTWLGYGGNGNDRDTPPTTISVGAAGAAGGGSAAAFPQPPNNGKHFLGACADFGTECALVRGRGVAKSSTRIVSLFTLKLGAFELINEVDLFDRPVPTRARENEKSEAAAALSD